MNNLAKGMGMDPRNRDFMNMDWFPVIEEDLKQFDRLSPEEALGLRHLIEIEQATLGMPPLDLKRATRPRALGTGR
ncbi:MAG: hypothetical protein SGI86_16600 [Deltaproteobacteria bacterium]|nr:hypothetical protein [Deltaproteobacteria bacterium]